jgi:hypothetical protein
MTIRNFEALAREWNDLEAAGIPLEPLENRVGIDARNSGAELTIRAGRDGWHSEIRELRNGSFAYILPVFIRRNLPGKTIIRDSWIETPWPESIIELLGDPKNEERPPGYYTFPGDTYRYPREKVLNHRINCELSRGEIREGLLLGVGLRPPENYKNQCKIEVTFRVLNQWDVEHLAKLQVQINRLQTRAKANSKSTKSHLLSRRDVIAPARLLAPPPWPPKENRKKVAEAMRRFLKDVARARSKSKNAKMPTGSSAALKCGD